MNASSRAAPPARQEPLFAGEFSFTGSDFETIAGILQQRAGISLPATKGALVYARLVKRLRLLGLESFSDYCALLTEPGGEEESEVVLRALTTNVTRFFREPHHFDDLYNQLVDLAPDVRAGGRLRLWSAGCSTGQEPYSMALTLLSVFPDAAALDIKILASDIDTDVLETGRLALYEEEELDAVPANLRGELEHSAGGVWRVGTAARDLVTFKELNLNAAAWPMSGGFQAIFCRNVAIYFDDPTQERLWRRFAPLATPNGRLYVGHSERVDDPAFQSCGLTSYRRLPVGGAGMSKVRVLVVDDSATMRGLIAAGLNRDPEIEVVGAAGDPYEARGAIKALNPDVITLDIEMPNMNGLDFLDKIMRLRPMPVVMVSSLTQAGAEVTLRALEIGAVDCVGKAGFGSAESMAEIAVKVKAAARASIRPRLAGQTRVTADATYRPSGDIVAIGASTGGVEALLALLGCFPENCPPTVITQHMPAAFTTSFAARLDRASAASVSIPAQGALLEKGKVYLAPGGDAHLEVHRHADGLLHCRLTEGDLVSGHRPSVDVLMSSVAHAAGKRAVGALLTGMGRDGAKGLLAMRDAGARTLGQDAASCVVYGMPKAAFEIGAVQRQVSISAMGEAILDLAAGAGARV